MSQPICVGGRTRVFLDNHVWNSLADNTGPFSLDDLEESHRAGRLEVVGSTRLLNEIMLTARNEPGKYGVMQAHYRKLVGTRTLKDLPELHIAEVLTGGHASVVERYRSRAEQQKMFDIMRTWSVIGEVNEEVYRQKIQGQVVYQSLSDELLRRIRELGKKRGDFEPSLDQSDLLPLVALLVEGAQKKFDLPPIDPASLSVKRVPSTWLHVAILVASASRWIRDNAKVKDSDQHDFWHAASGAYFDVLVTDDDRYSKALAMIEWLPFKISTVGEFQLWLADAGSESNL